MVTTFFLPVYFSAYHGILIYFVPAWYGIGVSRKARAPPGQRATVFCRFFFSVFKSLYCCIDICALRIVQRTMRTAVQLFRTCLEYRALHFH